MNKPYLIRCRLCGDLMEFNWNSICETCKKKKKVESQ